MTATALSLRNAVALRGATWAAAVLVAFLTLAPAGLRPTTPLPHDLEHFLAFLTVGTIVRSAYPDRRALLVSVLLIAALELLQTLVPGRHARTEDIAANLAGFLSGVAVVALWGRLKAGPLLAAGMVRRGPAPPVRPNLGLERPPALQAALDWGAKLRTVVFLVAVLAINYTLSRPSPVDFLFLSALLLTLVSQQRLSIQNTLFLFLVTTWLLSIYVSSLSLADKPEVRFQLLALTSVVLIAVTSCLVTSGWGERDFHKFIGVYVCAAVIAACIGIYGFAARDPDLTWDDRAKAFLDDPNMFGAFLVPGILGSLYMLAEGRRRPTYAAALVVLVTGLVLSFSRAAITFGLLWSGVYLAFLNRRNLFKAAVSAGAVFLVLGAACLIAYLTIDNFSEKLVERFTLAKDYDLGYGGRYSRYSLALPLLLDHPLGLGLYELDKYFTEPIHNIWISSFLNYGWLAGFAWTLLMILSVQVTWYNWKRTRNPICFFVLLSWLSIVSCAMLHQSERWRYLWLFTGIVWGVNYRNFAPAPGPGRR